MFNLFLRPIYIYIFNSFIHYFRMLKKVLDILLRFSFMLVHFFFFFLIGINLMGMIIRLKLHPDFILFLPRMQRLPLYHVASFYGLLFILNYHFLLLLAL